MDEKSSSTHSGNRIDAAFDRLHAAYFGQLPLPWEEFEAAALEFFDGTPANAWDL